MCEQQGFGFGPCVCDAQPPDAGSSGTERAAFADASAPANLDAPGPGGMGGTGGAGGMGGGPMGGGGEGGGSGAAPPPAACSSLQVRTLDEMETKFIMVRCGMGPGAPAVCHTTFPPTDLSKAGIRFKLLNRRSALCPDFYLNRAEPRKSFILAKISSPTPMVTCPSGGMPGLGGMKMPGPPAPPLNADELACFTWYVENAGL